MDKPLQELKKIGHLIHLMVEREASPTDKRAKYVYLTDSVKNKLNDMKQFFEEVDQKMMAGVSEEELAIFFKVMHQFYENMKKRSEE